MKEVELFKGKYRDAMEIKGFKVEYFGSTENSIKWRRGESDLDIFVYGNNISPEVKAEGVLLVKDLNDELHLGLDNVPFQHWTPIYIDYLGRKFLKELSENRLVRHFTEHVRDAAKGLNKIWWPITYRKWWNLVELAYKNMHSHLPLPPPYPPIPPILFLKML